MAREWHDSYETKDLLREYYLEHAYFPPEVDEARNFHSNICSTIRNSLIDLNPLLYNRLRLEFIGSAYERTEIPGKVEFDVELVIPASNIKLIPASGMPGFVYLKPEVNKFTNCYEVHHEDFVVDRSHPEGIPQGYLCAKQFCNRFFGDVQLCINDDPATLGGIKLRRHGTAATQMDVSYNGKLWYSVDMVPCLEFKLSNGTVDRYVSKPSPNDTTLWRKSFAVEEKRMLSKIDAGNTCRKQCLRILKAFCAHDDTLGQLTSYHMKNAVLNVNEFRQDDSCWRQNQLLECVMAVLIYLEKRLRKRRLSAYFLQSANLLSKFSQQDCMDIANRIQLLRLSQEAFESFIDV